MKPNVERVILRYHKRLLADPHHRYRSWGHCYRHFRRRSWLRAHSASCQNVFQLGFYLASWGMYRGSTFLLQKDVQIHRLVVRELLQPRYDWLRGYRPGAAGTDTRAIREMLDLVDRIRAAYCGQIRAVEGRDCEIYVSDALATKIILGTLACLPAYDSFVAEGLRLEGLPYSSLNERSIEALFDWYLGRQREFRLVQRHIDENGLRYPPIKLVDMYLWERGKRSR